MVQQAVPGSYYSFTIPDLKPAFFFSDGILITFSEEQYLKKQDLDTRCALPISCIIVSSPQQTE